MFLFKGYCTEFNVAGRVIQRHDAAQCNNIFPKCDYVYSSHESYKCTFFTNLFQFQKINKTL